jgi:hypothetical protein
LYNPLQAGDQGRDSTPALVLSERDLQSIIDAWRDVIVDRTDSYVVAYSDVLEAIGAGRLFIHEASSVWVPL